MADATIPEISVWVIYALRRPNRPIFYIGATNDLKRRLKEHRVRFGREVSAVILEEGIGDGRASSEHRWIEHYRSLGLVLANRTEGGDGAEIVSAATRAALSQANKGRTHTPEAREKIGAAHRGKPKNWSAEGAARRRETEFKPGHAKTPEQLAVMRDASKRYWGTVPPEVRSDRATERNKNIWSRYSDQERKQRGEAIKSGRAGITLEQRSKIASAAAKARAAKDPESLGRQVRTWWANLSPEDRESYLARRAEAIKRGKAEAKQRRERDKNNS